jgi:predicted metalloprotease with PDZ domain
MCLDILIREKSGGEKGVLWVMQNLAKRYGADKPFKDEELIDEIIAMTYPEVGDFFKTHVEGTQPINYEDYLSKVGLTRGETDIELPSILLKDSQSPFFMPQPNEEGTVQYVVTGLNSTIASMGVQEGDLFLGLDGTLFPEIKQENAEAINAIFTPTFMWDAQKDFSITVKRGEDLLTLTGVTGTPTVKAKGIVANPQADPNAIALRQSWLKE